MVLNFISEQIRKTMASRDYASCQGAMSEKEIPIGLMNDEEKAIYSLMENCKNERALHYLKRRMNNSLRRLNIRGIYWKVEKCEFREGFIIVMELDTSRLTRQYYLPCLN